MPDAARAPERGGWEAEAVAHSPDALAVVDADGRFVRANPAAAALCGVAAGAVPGCPSPFPLPTGGEPLPHPAVVEFEAAPGVRRALAYALRQVPGQERWVVSFRDVTASRLRERRLAAVATAAAGVAARRSLKSTLEALAQELARADSLAGVQILTASSGGDRLHVIGLAGFGRAPDFFDMLLRCRDLGAHLAMLDVLRSGEAQVVPHRYETTMTDPAWEPLREHLMHPRWDAFASVPLLVGGQTVGVLNAFFAPGQVVGEEEMEFLRAMAQQAAVAVDHAELLERERDVARREERQKLARDLHDSVVQQVFSIMMQSGSLGVLARRGLVPDAARLAVVADELSSAAEDVLADLRSTVHELRPAVSPGRGLEAAVSSLLDTTAARTGLRVALEVDDPGAELGALDPVLAEDVYRVVAEAVHNTVKHAGAAALSVALAVHADAGRRHLTAEVRDDGSGLPAPDPDGPPSSGFGMTAMRERAERWDGALHVRAQQPAGTAVRLELPLLTTVAVADPAARVLP
ncbi:GAF domain-containing protein [Kineosporiaceae bacterium B12]|nr:GAF domain-containing protein [Kineococcus rubinsiae]